jgi:hypothetical protein
MGNGILRAITDLFIATAGLGGLAAILTGLYMMVSTASLTVWPIDAMSAFLVSAIMAVAGLLGIAFLSIRAMNDPVRML